MKVKIWLNMTISFLVLVLCLSGLANAATITKVKGRKALVKMLPNEFKKGDILKIENADGKVVGAIKIQAVKGSLAQGIFKGNAKQGLTVSLRKSGASSKKRNRPSQEQTEDSYSSDSSETSKFNFWGVMVGMNSTTADVTTQTNLTAELKDTGFSALAFADYALMPQLNVRALAGLEQFNATGTKNICGTAANQACTAEITYLALEAWGRFLFSQGAYRPWVGAGFYMLFPMSKDSTALDSGSITNTSVFAFGGGIDIDVGENGFVPVQLEYDMYPSSDTVEASAIAGRIGYGFRY